MQDITGLAPNEVQETGVRKGLLEDIALKTLYLNGEMSLTELSKHMCLGVGVIDEIFQFFRKEQLCEVKGMVGGSHRIVASTQGRSRAAGLLAMSQYAGPAPVSLADYRLRVNAQTVQQTGIQPSDLKRALHPLILDVGFLARLGTAVVSGTSIFLYGPSGTGKTSIAGCIPAIYSDNVWIPYAVEVDGQIISVYDPGVHRECGDAVSEETDKRWVLCHRPRILTGGELSSEMLDIQISTSNRFYTAPLQMKANNGVLIL
ncbi:MAG: AAA family ATPase, partial [Chthoniobacterales bacterium]